jgi:Ca2+-binding RTX toxin-like protein
LLSASTVTINGTDSRDFITVTTSGSTLTITVNGTAQSHPLASVSALNIFCRGGDDIVIGTGSSFGFYVDAGDGNDKIIGGDGPDTVLGGAQKDIIYGGLGNDRLNGSGGNDKVLGEAGSDRLYGGDGNDYIDGGSSRDRIYGGGGVDTMLGQRVIDIVSALDKEADYVFGASGTDSAFVDAIDIRGSIEQVALV